MKNQISCPWTPTHKTTRLPQSLSFTPTAILYLAYADPLDGPVYSAAELVSTLGLPFFSKRTISTGHIQMDIDCPLNDLFSSF